MKRSILRSKQAKGDINSRGARKANFLDLSPLKCHYKTVKKMNSNLNYILTIMSKNLHNV